MNNYYDRLKKQWEKEGMVKGKEEQKVEPSLTVENFHIKRGCEKYFDFSQPLFINLKQFSTDTGEAPFSYFFARINWKYRKQA